MKITVYFGTSGIRTLTQGLDRRSIIFLKNVGWSILPLIGLTSTTKDFFYINLQLGPSRVRSPTFHVFKKKFKTPETSGAHNSAHQLINLHIYSQKKVLYITRTNFNGDFWPETWLWSVLVI